MTYTMTTKGNDRMGRTREGIVARVVFSLVVVLAPLTGIQAVAGAEETAPASPQWTSPTEIPVGFDWLQFESGEWLKGEIKALYDDQLEFDSDQMDLLKLDWEDVKELKSHAPVSVRFENDGVIEGIIRISQDTVSIIDGNSSRTFPRSELVSIAPAKSSEFDLWSGKVSLSVDVRKGNTDQISYAAKANVKRRTTGSRFQGDYLGIYDRTNDVETAQSNRFNGFYDIFQTRMYYWRPVFGEYFRDPFSNIDYRITLGTGVGYHFIDTSKTSLDITPGLAYQRTRNSSVAAGESPEKDTASLVVNTQLEHDITNDIDLTVTYNFNVVDKASGTYTHHAMAALSIELTDKLDLDLSAVWDRIQDPAERADGTIPERDDFYYFIGLGFEL